VNETHRFVGVLPHYEFTTQKKPPQNFSRQLRELEIINIPQALVAHFPGTKP
jgi:hypothetical protein